MARELQDDTVLFGLTGVGVVQTDLATGRFVRANQAFCEMVGYSEAELQAMTNAELTHPEDWERDAARFALLQLNGVREDRAVVRARCKDGAVAWLELNITLLGEGEQTTNIAVVSDVTARRQRELDAAFLADLQDDFARLSIPEEIVQTVGEKLGSYLNLASYSVLDIDESRAEEVTLSYFWGEPGVSDTLGAYRIGDFLTEAFIRASHAGEIMVVRDTQTDPRADASAFARAKTRAFVGVPYHSEGVWRHFLSVTDVEPRDWRDSEFELIGEVSSRLFDELARGPRRSGAARVGGAFAARTGGWTAGYLGAGPDQRRFGLPLPAPRSAVWV